MPDTTFEEARRCPRCGEPGKELGSTSVQGGARVHSFECENNRCRWFGTGAWLVQVNKDGTIPQRKPGEKDFPRRSKEQLARAQQALSQIENTKST